MPRWLLHEEALAIRRELGDKQGVAISLTNLGRAALLMGDPTRSKRLLEESFV